MNPFLKPLSKEDESLCIQALRDEDAERRQEARQCLIERNLRLVAHIAKKYASTEESMEDMISIGTIGLIKAVETFDPAKNSRLAAYAARCIDNAIRSPTRFWMRKKQDRWRIFAQRVTKSAFFLISRCICSKLFTITTTCFPVFYSERRRWQCE